MSAVAYRNSELYRYGANYQFGIFPLGYRNSYDYRSAIQYRSGVDDPIFDSFTVNVTETLTVSVTPTRVRPRRHCPVSTFSLLQRKGQRKRSSSSSYQWALLV